MPGRLWTLLEHSGRTVVFTGAGMSTESGLPDFRSQAGLWTRHDPFKTATVDVLHDDPETFFDFYRHRLAVMSDAQPNRGHIALAQLERAGLISSIITQNIDGLHRRAGSSNVIELHGSLSVAYCTWCEGETDGQTLRRLLDQGETVPRCRCGGMLRPAVTLFGEALPEGAYERAISEASSCGLLIVIGSSLSVWPAAGIPHAALRADAVLAIVNAGPTPLDEEAALIIREPAGEYLAAVLLESGVDDGTQSAEP